MIPGISETASWVLLFVTVAASVVWAWHRWEVVQALFGGAFKAFGQHQIEQRTADQLARHRAQQSRGARSDAPPALRLVRAGWRNGEGLLVLHNDGGFAQNPTVGAPEGCTVTVLPNDVWRPDTAIRVRVRASTCPPSLLLAVGWQDATGAWHTAGYTAAFDPPAWHQGEA